MPEIALFNGPASFTVVEGFYSEATHSEYVAGLTYLASAEDRLLRSLIPAWIEAGLIVLGGADSAVIGRE